VAVKVPTRVESLIYRAFHELREVFATPFSQAIVLPGCWVTYMLGTFCWPRPIKSMSA
jgi:hypothetical protein